MSSRHHTEAMWAHYSDLADQAQELADDLRKLAEQASQTPDVDDDLRKRTLRQARNISRILGREDRQLRGVA